MATNFGSLFLIPCTLGDTVPEMVLPQTVISIARRLSYFVVEQPKTARQFLARMHPLQPIRSLHFATLNEHTSPQELAGMLAPLLAGQDVGLISEAGCPGIADPGAELVNLAHRKGIRAVPLVGPSSIVLALMASGLNGQRFAFHGYLPIAEAQRNDALMKLEAESVRLEQTQIFIETPYRNDRMFAALIGQCQPKTQLCIATDLTLPTESIRTNTIRYWKSQPKPGLDKRPSIFLLQGAR